MTKRIVWLTLLLLAGLALTVTPTVRAQDNEPTDDEVNEIAKGLYCPVCENVPLDVCPTQACVQWRDQIRVLLQQGYTEAEIHEYFYNQFGERVLAAPPAEGHNVIFWVLPPVLFVVFAGVLVGVFRRNRALPAETTPTPAAPTTPEDDYLRRLEQTIDENR